MLKSTNIHNWWDAHSHWSYGLSNAGSGSPLKITGPLADDASLVLSDGVQNILLISFLARIQLVKMFGGLHISLMKVMPVLLPRKILPLKTVPMIMTCSHFGMLPREECHGRSFIRI